MIDNKQKGMLVGLAIGDALGMPLEFKQLGTFKPLETFGEGGPFNLPLGYWTDDTSMALCLADSILEKGGYDSYDIMDRYMDWQTNGYRSSTGMCFDIGNQVSMAIARYKSQPEITTSEQRTKSAGNGCIMRLAPVVIASLAAKNSLEDTIRLASISARETHFSTIAEEATALFAGLLFNAVKAVNKNQVLQLDTTITYSVHLLSIVEQAHQKTSEELRPTGYIIDTLEIAVWAFMTSDNFKDGALKAINLGGDSDTIGAVYGQLAGAYYGLSGIPQEWLEKLHDYIEIVNLAERLALLNDFGIIRTRFAEDKEYERLKLNKEKVVSDNNQSSNQSTNQDMAELKSWSNVGRPGPTPLEQFVPSEEQRQQLKPMNTPRIIPVDWKIDQETYKRLQLGHISQDMDDKWNIYTENDTVHFHRSWTGMESFRFKIQRAENNRYRIIQFEVEQDLERYNETDEEEIRGAFDEVLRAVLGIDMNNLIN